MNANGLSYPAYHLGTARFYGSPNGGFPAVEHVHHGHPVGAELEYPDTSGAIAANSAAAARSTRI